jgi:hypothetical protein
MATKSKAPKSTGTRGAVQKAPQHTGPTSCPVNTNAYICRQCPSGKYDGTRDACLEVIQIGVQKGQRRAGRINWLHYHPDAKCPLGHF